MTPPQQQGISNIEFVKGLAECLGKEPEQHDECNICPLRSKCIDLHLIRSRPATTPKTVVEDITPAGAAIVQTARKQAAAQAREEFADELKKDLKSRFVSSMNSWSKGRNSGLLECCNIIDESLRSSTKEQPSEANKR